MITKHSKNSEALLYKSEESTNFRLYEFRDFEIHKRTFQ